MRGRVCGWVLSEQALGALSCMVVRRRNVLEGMMVGRGGGGAGDIRLTVDDCGGVEGAHSGHNGKVGSVSSKTSKNTFIQADSPHHMVAIVAGCQQQQWGLWSLNRRWYQWKRQWRQQSRRWRRRWRPLRLKAGGSIHLRVNKSLSRVAPRYQQLIINFTRPRERARAPACAIDTQAQDCACKGES